MACEGREVNECDEFLLIGSEASDPFAVKIINPLNGVSSWSYRGSELQSAVSGCVEPLGNAGDIILISAKDKPLVHALSVNPHRRRHLKSVLNGSVENIVTSSDGSLVFISIGAKLFVWMVCTGELISVIEAHHSRISTMCLTYDNAFLTIGSDDGTLIVFQFADLVHWNIGSFEKCKPYREWRVHSLSVKRVCCNRFGDSRIISCALDHTIAIHSILRNQCLLKISGDEPLTCCTVDALSRYLIIGTSKGNIAQISLYVKSNVSERMIVTSGGDSDELPIFAGHSSEITCLDVNRDGKLLASGDSRGFYFIWDVLSRQCIISTQMRGSISKLLFIWDWPSITDKDYVTPNVPLATLKRQQSQPEVPKQIIIPPRRSCDPRLDDDEKFIISDLDRRIDDFNMQQEVNNSQMNKAEQMKELETKLVTEQSKASDGDNDIMIIDDDHENEQLRALQKRISELEQINQQLYDYAANLILDTE